MAGISQISYGYTAGTAQQLRRTPAPAATFLKGMPLILDAQGRAKQCIAAGNLFALSALLVGIAGEDATLLQGGNAATLKQHVGILTADPTATVTLPLYNPTAASAVFDPSTVGTAYDLRILPSGVPVVDNSSTAHPCFRLVDVLGNDYPGWPVYNGVGTVQYPLCVFRFVAAACLLTGDR